ncbi:MAG: nuclear transport factor 2 family protein [Bdellovibrionales bacterium]
MNANTLALIQKYYQAFNQQNIELMLQCLHPQIEHDINEGATETGLDQFRLFLYRMNTHYREHLTDLKIMVDESGKFASAHFLVNGTYLSTDGGLPPARGQNYKIPALGYFEVLDGKIKRVSTFYNLKKWIEAVS